jgi:hypothetical protein
MTHGLNRGEVVIDLPSLVQNGGNLTTDPDPQDHGLGEARSLTARERRILERVDGVCLPKGARFPDKRRVRIEIDLPKDTHGLAKWLQWPAANVDRATRDALIRSGGGIAKASAWYVSFAAIPPSAFVAIGIRDHAGTYVTCRSRTEVQQAIMALKLPGVRLVPLARRAGRAKRSEARPGPVVVTSHRARSPSQYKEAIMPLNLPGCHRQRPWPFLQLHRRPRDLPLAKAAGRQAQTLALRLKTSVAHGARSTGIVREWGCGPTAPAEGLP